jgi:hypothetical protein
LRRSKLNAEVVVVSEQPKQSEKSDVLPKDRQAWRVKEYCEAHRISNSTFWKYARLGKIKIIRIGGRVLIPHAEALRISSEGLK